MGDGEEGLGVPFVPDLRETRQGGEREGDQRGERDESRERRRNGERTFRLRESVRRQM